jgi:hypothetical protein
MCYTEDGTASLCPARRFMNNAMRPSYRLTHIRITAPAALASPILGNVVNDAVHRGGFLWGMTFDLMANTFRTGALNAAMVRRGTTGQGLLDGQFAYYAGNAPTMGGAATRWDPSMAPLMATSDRVSTMAITGTIRLPIFDGSGAVLTELPLENAALSSVQLTADRGCIGLGEVAGGRFDECTSNWATAENTGVLRAVILASEARTVNVSALKTTLCNLLAGSNCETVPQAMWMRQPDAMVNGMPGYNLTAQIAAVSANIQ